MESLVLFCSCWVWGASGSSWIYGSCTSWPFFLLRRNGLMLRNHLLRLLAQCCCLLYCRLSSGFSAEEKFSSSGVLTDGYLSWHIIRLNYFLLLFDHADRCVGYKCEESVGLSKSQLQHCWSSKLFSCQSARLSARLSQKVQDLSGKSTPEHPRGASHQCSHLGPWYLMCLPCDPHPSRWSIWSIW